METTYAGGDPLVVPMVTVPVQGRIDQSGITAKVPLRVYELAARDAERERCLAILKRLQEDKTYAGWNVLQQAIDEIKKG